MCAPHLSSTIFSLFGPTSCDANMFLQTLCNKSFANKPAFKNVWIMSAAFFSPSLRETVHGGNADAFFFLIFMVVCVPIQPLSKLHYEWPS